MTISLDLVGTTRLRVDANVCWYLREPFWEHDDTFLRRALGDWRLGGDQAVETILGTRYLTSQEGVYFLISLTSGTHLSTPTSTAKSRTGQSCACRSTAECHPGSTPKGLLLTQVSTGPGIDSLWSRKCLIDHNFWYTGPSDRPHYDEWESVRSIHALQAATVTELV